MCVGGEGVHSYRLVELHIRLSWCAISQQVTGRRHRTLGFNNEHKQLTRSGALAVVFFRVSDFENKS